MPEPAPTGAAADACRSLARALPDEVAGQRRRHTDPGSDLTAAWGEPAITLRCGVAAPAALTPTSTLLTVNGVDWLPEPLTAGYLFTTVGRVAGVEVAVPAAYAPEAGALTDLAPAVAGTVALDNAPSATAAAAATAGPP